jgi:hypothetical protein
LFHSLSSAQYLQTNPQILNGSGISTANEPRIVALMGQVITFQFRRPRLPRRLLNDGWWLESPPARPSLIAFPMRNASKPTPKSRQLTLVTPGK